MIQKSKVLQELPTQFFAHLVQQVNQKIAEGQDVINLGQGNPDQPSAGDEKRNAQESVLSHQKGNRHHLGRGFPFRRARGADDEAF